MRIRTNERLFIICFLCVIACKLTAQLANEKKMITIPAEVVTDKIRGGLLGQIIGDLNGLPYENKYDLQPGIVQEYTPSLPKGAWSDDDTDFEWVYIFEMQKSRKAIIPYQDISTFWKERVNKGVWCANRFARYLMDLGIDPPLTGSIALNPWAEFNLSGQFLCETYGLLSPAMPQTAAKIGTHYTKVAIDYEPAQATQFFTSMIATAFVEPDINKIIDAGLAAVDPKSVLVQLVNDIRSWYKQFPDDWKQTRIKLREKYYLKDEVIRNRNGIVLNTGSVITALLYGKGDFNESVRLGFNMGWDADCNSATIGTIAGVKDGYRNMLSKGWIIVDRFRNATRDNMPMDETITSFADRLIELFEMINESNGGKRTIKDNRVVYDIQSEKPSLIVKLEPIEDQKTALQQKLKTDIINDLQKGSSEQKARAAYYAVCLDFNSELQKKYPKQWKEACYQLSGFWKVMNNIFYADDSPLMKQLEDKFTKAEFKKPVHKLTDNEIYSDRVAWKEPKTLY